jgi:flagella basal body P-ring formation protein FlgA
LLSLRQRQCNDETAMFELRSLFAFVALSLLAAFAHAQAPQLAAANYSLQSLEQIRHAAESHVRALLPPANGKYFVTAGRLDSRLRLASCSSPLEAFVNGSVQTRTTVGVRCNGTGTWTIYVPVTVEMEAQVLVLRRALARRAPIDASDVELQTRRLPGIATNFVNDLNALEGRRLRRALAAGTPLTVDALDRAVLVQRGQQVTVVAAAGGIEIRAQGKALSDGGEQDRIRVQNVNSLKVVEGVIENSGVVRVDF